MVERAWHAGGDVAEGTRPRAGVAHDHHGGVALRPAFADVGAGGFLADGRQAVLTHQSAGLVINRVIGRLDADPGGLALDGVVRAMRLLRVTEPVVDDDVRCHGGERSGGRGMGRQAVGLHGRWRNCR